MEDCAGNTSQNVTFSSPVVLTATADSGTLINMNRRVKGHRFLQRCFVWVLAFGFCWSQTVLGGTFPFTEDFESIADGAAWSSGSGGWTHPTGIATVRTDNAVANGGDDFGVLGGSGGSGYVTNTFADTGATNPWYVVYSQPQFREFELTDHPDVVSGTTAAFYINSNGNFVVFDGDGAGSGTWDIRTNTAVGGVADIASASTWLRINVALDYGSDTWALFVDDVLLADEVGFSDAGPAYLARVEMFETNGVAYFDDIKAWLQPPTGGDARL